MSSLFSFNRFDFGEAQDVNSLLQGYGWCEEGVNLEKQKGVTELEEWGGNITSLWSQGKLYQDNTPQQIAQLCEEQQPLPELKSPYDFPFDVFSAPTEPSSEPAKLELLKSKKVKPSLISPASLKLLTNFRSGQKRLHRDAIRDTNPVRRRLSTEEIMRVAGAWYIEFSGQKLDDECMSKHPLDSIYSGLDKEETKDVELVCFLLVSGEKVGNQNFYQASNVISHCNHLSASTSNPVQRVVYCFVEALRERINRGIGITPLKGLCQGDQPLDVEEKMMSANPALLAFHQELPFSQVVTFVGMQAIVENVATRKKIHVIDVGLRTGMHWTVLIHAIASRCESPVELLKITAVGKPAQSTTMEETGMRLLDFADTMKLKFSFEVIIISDMKDLKEDLFAIGADEAVAVYAPFLLRTMLPWPDHLETMMEVFSKIKPRLMVVTEMEANQNSPSFFNRFTNALFLYSALFDCLIASTNEDNKHKMDAVGISFDEGVQNIVATEGEERTTRSVGINVWKSFFARFSIVETELSQICLDQASLILKNFATGSSCTIHMRGECLTVGWKGTPILSVSAWKFH